MPCSNFTVNFGCVASPEDFFYFFYLLTCKHRKLQSRFSPIAFDRDEPLLFSTAQSQSSRFAAQPHRHVKCHIQPAHRITQQSTDWHTAYVGMFKFSHVHFCRRWLAPDGRSTTLIALGSRIQHCIIAVWHSGIVWRSALHRSALAQDAGARTTITEPTDQLCSHLIKTKLPAAVCYWSGYAAQFLRI